MKYDFDLSFLLGVRGVYASGEKPGGGDAVSFIHYTKLTHLKDLRQQLSVDPTLAKIKLFVKIHLN